MNEKIKLSVVIPCLNERKTIGICIKKILTVFDQEKINGEIVIADNGSSDGSQAFSKTFEKTRVVNVEKKGYGQALKEGITQSSGEYIIMGDADDSYDFLEIPSFMKEIKNGYSFVIGCRLPKHGGILEKGAMPFLHQHLGTPVLSKINNILFSNHFHDCNCGMRLFSKDAFLQMKMESSGMEFASEMLAKVGTLKIKSKEIPIHFYKDKRDRKPHLNTWRDGFRHLYTLIYLRLTIR